MEVGEGEEEEEKRTKRRIKTSRTRRTRTWRTRTWRRRKCDMHSFLGPEKNKSGPDIKFIWKTIACSIFSPNCHINNKNCGNKWIKIDIITDKALKCLTSQIWTSNSQRPCVSSSFYFVDFNYFKKRVSLSSLKNLAPFLLRRTEKETELNRSASSPGRDKHLTYRMSHWCLMETLTTRINVKIHGSCRKLKSWYLPTIHSW